MSWKGWHFDRYNFTYQYNPGLCIIHTLSTNRLTGRRPAGLGSFEEAGDELGYHQIRQQSKANQLPIEAATALSVLFFSHGRIPEYD